VEDTDGSVRRPDGWCLVWLVSGRYGTSSGWMEQWSDEHPEGMARSSWRLTGNRNLRRAKSTESALNSGIPVYSIFTYISDFVQTQNEAKILTVTTHEASTLGFVLRYASASTLFVLAQAMCFNTTYPCVHALSHANHPISCFPTIPSHSCIISSYIHYQFILSI